MRHGPQNPTTLEICPQIICGKNTKFVTKLALFVEKLGFFVEKLILATKRLGKRLKTARKRLQIWRKRLQIARKRLQIFRDFPKPIALQGIWPICGKTWQKESFR